MPNNKHTLYQSVYIVLWYDPHIMANKNIVQIDPLKDDIG
ncbi:hypothetical protein GALL_303950 [mine drainage metagenome]|uniref:Uncharacterized protein n=1 Tax=mine drainage metagenome TaxID=410659 RepID=A0A1J5R6T1_9ZZZZ